MQLLEVTMLLCFGASWPVSIHKSWTSRRTGGKSGVFLCLILAGYLAGAANKLLSGVDYVLAFYLLNAGMVGTDMGIFIRNRRLERACGLEGPTSSPEAPD